MAAGTVSIVIPVYNNEKYLTKCLESVTNQTYQELEIIVVDDGSTDSSGAICDQYATKDDRIRVCHQKNGGVSNARNNGIAVATGEYLTFIDGDDYIGPDYISDFVRCAKKHNAQMVICGMKKVSVADQVLETIIPGEYIRYEHEEWCCRICTVACHFYQKALWDRYEIRFQEGERGEDIPIALFFAGICEPIVTLQKAEYYYVQHESSAMHKFQGLKDISLPYDALEGMINKLQVIGVKNSSEFHELFVLRILATFLQLANGAGKKEQRKLNNYILKILNEYYSRCYKNKKIKIFNSLDIPFAQKLAVKTLVCAYRWRMIGMLTKSICR